LNRTEQFLSQYSDQTRATYRIALADFASISGKDSLFASVDDLILYQTKIAHQAPGTIAKKLAILSSYHSFLIKVGDRTDNPVAPLRRKRPDPMKTVRWLEDEEVDALLEVAKKTGKRELALVWLALHGLRVGEIVSLNINQYRQGVLWNLVGKSKKVRIVPLTPKAQTALNDYIGKRKAGPLLLSTPGKRLSRRHSQRLISNLTEKAGKKINIHGLRHTYGTRATRRGVPTVTLAKLMGHESVSTTEKYVHLSSVDLQIANDLIYESEDEND
jgi:site-specific recombinase XerD